MSFHYHSIVLSKAFFIEKTLLAVVRAYYDRGTIMRTATQARWFAQSNTSQKTASFNLNKN